MGNPYAIPFCEITFDPTYQMLSDLGYNQSVSMKDVWADILTDLESQKEENNDVGLGSLETAPAEDAKIPEELAPSDAQVQLLWLENTVGAICLRPIPLTISVCSFTNDVSWRIGDSNETPTPDNSKLLGQGSEKTIDDHPISDTIQESQISNIWSPVADSDFTNLFREISWTQTRSATVGPGNTIPTVVVNPTFLMLAPSILTIYEHFIVSQFNLEKNASFAFSFVPQGRPPQHNASNNTDDTSKIPAAYFRIYWGKTHGIQWDGIKLQYSYNAWATGDDAGKEWVDITGLSTKPIGKGLYAGTISLVVQIIGNSIVISNLEDVPPSHSKEAKHGWTYQFKDTKSFQEGITVESDSMYAGWKGMTNPFAYIPIYYTPEGSFTSRKEKTGANLEGVTTDTNSIKNGGTVEVTTTVTGNPDTGEEFQFKAKLTGNTLVINTTPQLFTVNISTPAVTGQVSIKQIDTTGRVRSLTLDHGIFDQSGTIVLDNRDGKFKDNVGVFPVTIKAGWIRADGTVEADTRFRGFATNIEIDKKGAPYSTATLQLVGRKAQLQDAIAVNLPIYDGEIHTDAVVSLLQRGGWAQPVNLFPNGNPYFEDPTYRLSTPAKPGDQPLYMFSLGASIWTCIEEIARPTGYWSYVDSLGTFNYVPPFEGTEKITYREVPSTQGVYDEWLSLSVAKETQDIRNAVIVVGLDASFETPKYLVSVIKPTLGTIGIGDPTVGTSGNFVPWLRWIVVQDAKINDQKIVEWVARRVHDNNNRPRWTIKGQVWGNHTIFPLDTIKVNLKTDQISMPQGIGGKWRVLKVSETLDGEHKTYMMNIEAEWIDSRYSYAAWWGREAN